MEDVGLRDEPRQIKRPVGVSLAWLFNEEGEDKREAKRSTYQSLTSSPTLYIPKISFLTNPSRSVSSTMYPPPPSPFSDGAVEE